MTDELKTATTWQERAVLELKALGMRIAGLRKALLGGMVTDPQSVAFMQDQYKAMCAYHDALELRLRHTGVIGTETPLTVREERGTPACVEVTVSAPAGKRAEVSLSGPMGHPMRLTVTEGQTQSWSVIGGEQLTVTQASTSNVAHKRETD